MGAEAVRRDQRYTRDNPRPICDGWDRMARGTGRRCHGLLAADGSFARCRREEQAGTRPIEVGTGCYVRKLTGDCARGIRHNPTPRDGVRLALVEWGNRPRRTVSRTDYRLHDGPDTLVAIHRRNDDDDGDKSVIWYGPSPAAIVRPVASHPLPPPHRNAPHARCTPF